MKTLWFALALSAALMACTASNDSASVPEASQLQPQAAPSGALPRNGWRVQYAAPSANNPSLILDGNESSIWISTANQNNNLNMRIDLGAVRTFDKLVLEAGTGSQNYLRSYHVYLSDTDGGWGPMVASGNSGSTRLEVNLTGRSGRYVTIQNAYANPGKPWSVAEMWLTKNTTTPPASVGFTPKKSLNIFLDDGDYRGLPSLASEMPRLKRAGLDTVRLMISPDKFMGPYGNFNFKPALDQAIQALLSANLNVVVDSHANNAISFPGTSDPFNDTVLCTAAGMKKYEIFLETFARFLNGYPKNRVAFELMNEPNLASCPQTWQPLLTRMYNAARSGSPDIMLVLSGPDLSGPFSLNQVTPFPNDANTIYTVHYYGPLEFSHQGAFYVGGQEYLNYFAGIPYPTSRLDAAGRTALWNKIAATIDSKAGVPREGSSGDKVKAKAALDSYLNYNNGQGYGRADIDFAIKTAVVAWADSNRIPRSRIWLGEFGVQGSQFQASVPAWRVNPFEGANPTDRAEWTRDVREIFEQYGMGWAYFQYGNGAYSILLDRNFPTTNTSAWDPSITSALGLSTP